MKFKLIYVFLPFVLLFFQTTSVSAKDFKIKSDTLYYFLENGDTGVTHKIQAVNINPLVYLKSYSLTISDFKPNDLSCFEENIAVTCNLLSSADSYKIEVVFDKVTAGRDAVKNFTIKYVIKGLSQKNGSIWDITIPRFANIEDFDEYNIGFSVPVSFGKEAFLSPREVSGYEENGRKIYRFLKSDISEKPITASFGNVQMYDFSIKYFLENKNNKPETFELALPPDTQIQKVFYNRIDPKPSNVVRDSDGNWMAYYKLKRGEKINILASGVFYIYPQAVDKRANLYANSSYYTSSQKYWEKDNPKIKDIAKNLKTARDVYDYVISTLDYDKSRINQNTQRYGAVKALSYPKNALCMEYTDLFIAISRAIGIPSREIIGYAKSDNPETQPLSFFGDILHSWPEYWDQNTSSWRPIDPTWEDTTGGVDYFNNFDMSHITFVIHGKNSEYPYPAGAYKSPDLTKDINISYRPLANAAQTNISHTQKISFDLKKFKFVINFEIQNLSNYALNYLRLSTNIPRTQSLSKDLVLPPYSRIQERISVPINSLTFSSPSQIMISINNDLFPANSLKSDAVVMLLLIIFVPLLIILGAIYFFINFHRLGNIFPQRKST